jgi:hypothetical protein
LKYVRVTSAAGRIERWRAAIRSRCLRYGNFRSGAANQVRSRGRPNAEDRAVTANALQGTHGNEKHDAGGWLYRLELVDCGKGASGRCRKCADGPGHGPYWYRYRWSDGKMHKRYVGKTLPARSGPAAHDELKPRSDKRQRPSIPKTLRSQ